MKSKISRFIVTVFMIHVIRSLIEVDEKEESSRWLFLSLVLSDVDVNGACAIDGEGAMPRGIEACAWESYRNRNIARANLSIACSVLGNYKNLRYTN